VFKGEARKFAIGSSLKSVVVHGGNYWEGYNLAQGSCETAEQIGRFFAYLLMFTLYFLLQKYEG
jgi:hypothetical protein